MRFANVLKLNATEWPFLATQLELDLDWKRGCRTLVRESDVRLVAITRGARGSVLVTEEGVIEQPADTILITDIVGAGDAYCAALSVGLLRDLPLRDIQASATKVSSFVCTQAGATPPLPDALKLLATLSTLTPPQRRWASRRSPSALVTIPHARLAVDGEPAESR